ncbi:MAG: helix-turn-helix domain-containing protein [Peptococcaceae bacterium]|jgi:TrpR-related protein YerC/YecD|nr:helix-turn-helix domain-containing protein [Peptococcaceae bacterium]
MIYRSKLQTPLVDELFHAILALDDQEDCYRFFEDLCTVGELKAMSQRWKVVKMLSEQRTYADIIAETGVSTATISRVKKCLFYGADGYQRLADRVRKTSII